MKLFISWSGEPSRQIAEALRDWLPMVVNSVEPFISSKDIDAGSRWLAEVSGQLKAADFGIVCVTKTNVQAPWLNFEAGALGKTVDASAVIPLLHEVKRSDVQGPLTQFQMSELNREGIYEIVLAINRYAEAGHTEVRLANLFDLVWPKLEEALGGLPEAPGDANQAPPRQPGELLEEVLSIVRTLDRKMPQIARAPVASPPSAPATAEQVVRAALRDRDVVTSVDTNNCVSVALKEELTKEESALLMNLALGMGATVRILIMNDPHRLREETYRRRGGY
jgi:hypothetical protein